MVRWRWPKIHEDIIMNSCRSCCICGTVLVNPVTLVPCGHSVCKRCGSREKHSCRWVTRAHTSWCWTSDTLQEVRCRCQVLQREYGGGRSWSQHLCLDLPGGGQGLGQGEEGCAAEGGGQQAFPGGQRPNYLRKCNTKFSREEKWRRALRNIRKPLTSARKITSSQGTVTSISQLYMVFSSVIVLTRSWISTTTLRQCGTPSTQWLWDQIGAKAISD